MCRNFSGWRIFSLLNIITWCRSFSWKFLSSQISRSLNFDFCGINNILGLCSRLKLMNPSEQIAVKTKLETITLKGFIATNWPHFVKSFSSCRMMKLLVCCTNAIFLKSAGKNYFQTITTAQFNCHQTRRTKESCPPHTHTHYLLNTKTN